MPGVLKVYNASTSTWENVVNIANSQFTLVENQTPTGTINGTNKDFTVATGFVASTLKVYKNGVRMKPGGEDYTATSTGFTMTVAPATGTVLLCDYALGDGTNVVGGNSLVSDEVPTGTVNGTNKVFTTAQGYVGATLQVFINGVKQKRTVDFVETTPSTGTFTMDEAPLTGDAIFVCYSYNLNPSSNADTVDGINANTTATANNLMPLDANAKFSSNLLSNPYKFSAYRNAALNTTAGWTNIFQIDAEKFDTNNNYNTSTYKYTVPVTGYYSFYGGFCFAAGAAGRHFVVSIFVDNGEAFRGTESTSGASANFAGNVATPPIYLTANQYVTLGVYIDTGSLAVQSAYFGGYLVSSL